MKIFISWSGSPSREVAGLFSDWIKNVLQGAETWISKDDIDKGSIWFNEIASQLTDTTAGILCLTSRNCSAPWILFEAGALSKGLTSSRVCPLLIDLPVSELQPPLSQLNCTLPQRDDMLKLVKDINKLSNIRVLDENRVEKQFEKWWPEFKEVFDAILEVQKPDHGRSKRDPQEMLEEILQVVRSLQRSEQKRGSLDQPEARSVRMQSLFNPVVDPGGSERS